MTPLQKINEGMIMMICKKATQADTDKSVEYRFINTNK